MFAKLIRVIRRYLSNQSTIAQSSVEIKSSIATQSEMINRKLTELTDLVRLLAQSSGNQQITAAYQQMASNDVNNGLQAPPFRLSAVATQSHISSFEDVMSEHPLVFARKTYNTAHPDYDAQYVRNYPGKVFNPKNTSDSPVWYELRKLMRGDSIPPASWKKILEAALEEAKTVPHAEQIFERKQYVEKYLKSLEDENQAYYRPGWVNLDDALFLYWLVRNQKPKCIVQTGVCNGLSSAFMMLALVKNGEGSLHVVDMPPVYDSKDPAWKIKNKLYGVTIPEGKTSGWLVPEAYQDRFEVLSGDAKLLLPELLKKLGSCDMFYHDSDHTYDHMMFEFVEVKKYLTTAGIMVSDDIAWNASLWDFADRYNAPSYNHNGSMGVACF